MTKEEEEDSIATASKWKGVDGIRIRKEGARGGSSWSSSSSSDEQNRAGGIADVIKGLNNRFSQSLTIFSVDCGFCDA